MKTGLPLILLVILSIFLYKEDGIFASSNYMPQDSELALLMRKIHADAKVMRSDLINEDRDLVYDPSIEFILNASPTRPSVQGPDFEAFSKYYIQKTQELVENGDEEDYNKMVESCIACHQEFCPGPIKTINKLRIRPSSAQ